MSGGLFNAFEEYGMVRAGGNDIIGSEKSSTDDLVAFVCGTVGYYYLSLNASREEGHALGAIVYHQTFGLSDIIIVRLNPHANLATMHLRKMPR